MPSNLVRVKQISGKKWSINLLKLAKENTEIWQGEISSKALRQIEDILV